MVAEISERVSDNPLAVAPGEVVIVLGKKGFGKTCLLMDLVESSPGFDYVFIVDPACCLGDLDGHYNYIEIWDVEAGNIPIPENAKTLFVFDELDMYADAHVPLNKIAGGRLYEIFHLGRHMGCSVVASARRPANLRRDCLALASRVYVGNISDDRDADRIRDLDDSISPSDLKNLKIGEFIQIDL